MYIHCIFLSRPIIMIKRYFIQAPKIYKKYLFIKRNLCICVCKMVIKSELISIEYTNKKTLISKIPALNRNSILLFRNSKNILIRGNGAKLSGISREGHLPRFVITSTEPRAFESLSSLIYYSLFHGHFPSIIYTKT